MNYADKSEIPFVDRKENVHEVMTAYKQFLSATYPCPYLVETIRRQAVNNWDGLRSQARLFSANMKINPFALLYEISLSSPAASGYSIFLPSILSEKELLLTSVPLGITGKFFKSIYTNYATDELFCLNDIISSVKGASASAETTGKLSLALKRLLFVHAIIIEEAETEKP